MLTFTFDRCHTFEGMENILRVFSGKNPAIDVGAGGLRQAFGAWTAESIVCNGSGVAQ